ncbi:MAG: RtcB family protein [Clostridia bacterium]|nr:RtcB family protein [Clostridia bacterium]
MIEIQGRYNTAICYTDTLQESAREQIREMCDQRIFSGSKIRIMPDVHAGKGCTIGTTMTVTDKAVPNLAGVDIGCGMETVRLEKKEMDFAALDQLIRSRIPSGNSVRNAPHPLLDQVDLESLRCASAVDLGRARLSLGTLGGGNHFIEVDRDEEGFLYLVIHSGSRYLGVQTASHYQHLGWAAMNQLSSDAIQERIDRCKAEGRPQDIEAELKALRSAFASREQDVPMQFAYVEGKNLSDYLHDMQIVQRFAALNRQAMVQTILEGMGLTETERFTTIHNYIDTEHMILRKGSVSARKGERLLIPINMRDGALICVGRGNPEWNESAPHGAGRILSRKAAQDTLTVEAFQREMEGIFTTCVAQGTLDESPMAYKGLEEILSQIGPTAKVVRQIKPVYNFKAQN